MNFYPTISAQKSKQTNKESNLVTLTVSCEKTSCLIRSKKKKTKQYKKKENENRKLQQIRA